MLLKFFLTIHKSSVSKGFTEQIMPILSNLCYNGDLVTRTVVCLTTVKFKPVIFSTFKTPVCSSFQWCRDQEKVGLYVLSPIRLHGLLLN
jgi:hypothetical protein